MTYISPLLQNNLKQNNGTYKKSAVDHNKLYENLAKDTTNAVKPNEAKARLVKNTPVTDVIDLGKDCANFKKAVTKGEISDNNLGRLNDLGMKIGSGLIAAYLAVHAKTKTDAIMKFVGGGAFLASMSLWPKLAINTPMKLMHKVDPGQKYISAQGDKKDFFLDNQFILWDAAGISDEKEQRRQQKAALQARTLSLATVGAATPLAASLIGNAVQPKIYNAVVNGQVKKVNSTIADSASLAKYMESTKPQIENAKKIETLINDYKTGGKQVDDNFFKELADELNIKGVKSAFNNNDDVAPLKNIRSNGLIEQLKSLSEEKSIVDTESLSEALKDVILTKNIEKKNDKAIFGKISDLKASKQQMAMTKEEIASVVAKMGENKSVTSLKAALKDAGLTQEQIETVIPKVKVNSDEFFEAVKEYNNGTLAQLKGRVKGYLDLLNPVVGSRSESAYTKEFNDTMKNLINELGVDYKTLKEVKGKDVTYSQKLLSQIFASQVENVERGSEEYKALISKLTKGATPEEINELVKKLGSDEIISSVKGSASDSLTEAIVGSKETKGGFANAISAFIHRKELDLQASKIKPAICANFEARLKEGEFDGLGKEGIEIAKQLVYDGTSSVKENAGYAHNKNFYDKVVEAVYNKNAFDAEKGVISNIDELVENIKLYTKKSLEVINVAESNAAGAVKKKMKDVKFTNDEKYFMTGSMSELFKESATNLYNDKSWLRKFGGLAIILTAATLLIQPFFGNIKKEYPANGEQKSGDVK